MAIPAQLRKRYAREARFRFYGIAALCGGAGILAVLLITIVITALPAMTQHYITLDVPQEIVARDYNALADYDTAVADVYRPLLPANPDRRTRRALWRTLTLGAATLAQEQLENAPKTAPAKITLPLASQADLWLKGATLPNSKAERTTLAWLEDLREAGMIERSFAWGMFSFADSREPELAGIKGALVGSLLTLILVFAFSFPIGVGTAVYLQELAPKNRLTDFLEVNMNNLAAVPSIVFGLLGLAIFINLFGLPRSAPLVGAMVLSLMTLPTIIISARASLAAVPDSLRYAALALGASRMQVIGHHTLPLALPGIMTGTIIGLAGAAGETAPLLMIGMLAFVVDVPTSFTDAATALPAQIYIWADSPQRAFQAKTSMAILVLLGVLFVLNAVAVYLRVRFQKKY